MAAKTPADDTAKKRSPDAPFDDVTPLDYQHAPSQPRVRPQWDPVEIARKALDDMEKGGRLHHQNRRGG